jgi:hypothetical protein
MPVIATADRARPTRRRANSNGTGFWLTSYIGANRYTPDAAAPPKPGELYPMAFLVEQDAGAVVGAHYHQADQFQVIVAGSGRLGRHDVAAGAVHFAGAWSAYGPLAAGSDGLQYFTLRNGWDPGARYMEFSDNRSALRAQRRRHRESVGTSAAAADGLRVKQLVLTAGHPVTGIDPANGAGQFWVVLSGDLLSDDASAPRNSCLFVSPDEPPLQAVAGADGVTLLLMQFPREARQLVS